MALTEREIRKIINTKQSAVEFKGIPSRGNMVDGQIAVNKNSVANAGAGAGAIRTAGMFSAAGSMIGAGAEYKKSSVPSSSTSNPNTSGGQGKRFGY